MTAKKKILVIDDEPDLGELLTDFLSGYEIASAVRPEKGIEMVSSFKPDVVLLDVMMPGMDGLECLREIKAVAPDLVVIMVSGLHEDRIAVQALKQGAYDYITKPVNHTYLRDHLLARLLP